MGMELDVVPVVATVELLHLRIAERFPGSGLSRVGAQVLEVARETAGHLHELRRPYWGLRVLSGAAILLIAAVMVFAAWQFVPFVGQAGVSAGEMAQGLDAAVNEMLLLGLAILFLASVEERLKRRRALDMLHRLRGLAHVVDMHQLTKDPEMAQFPHEPTAHSPKRTLTRFQLSRYLDYCTELLALLSKLAALHTQRLQDPVVLSAVNDVETLAGSLSAKIWQKIMILDMTIASTTQLPPPLPKAERPSAPSEAPTISV